MDKVSDNLQVAPPTEVLKPAEEAPAALRSNQRFVLSARDLIVRQRAWWAGKELGRQFWIFFAAAFFYDLGAFIFFLLFNLYMIDGGSSEKLLGGLTSALALGSLAGTLPAGFFAKRFGLRKALLLCFVAVPVLSALRVLAVGATLQIGLAFFAGAAMSIWAVSISPVLAQLTTEKTRPFAFSLVFSSGIGVGVLGGLIGGMLPGGIARMLSIPASLRVTQITLLISCAVVGVGLWPIARLRLPATPAWEKKSYPRNNFLLRFLIAIALWSLVTGSLGPFFNIYFSQHLHLSVPHIGMVFSVAQLSQVLAILLSPLIYKRLGVVSGIVYTQIAAALALGGLAAVKITSGAVVMYTSYMAFQWMSEPGMYSLLMSEIAPSQRSGASALNFFVVSLASAAAAAAAGQGFARLGYPQVMSITAGLAIVAALAFHFLLSKTQS